MKPVAVPIRPPPLKPGDCVAVVAPSSPFPVDGFERGEAWLRQRYRVLVREDVLARAGYLAGDDDRRAKELADALAHPEVRAIVAARGGYGATRFCTELDWGLLARSPKWMVGFSDITALHVEASRVGVQSLHAPMLAWLGNADDEARSRLIDALEGHRPQDWDALTTVVPGRAMGRIYGGNIAMLDACAASGRLQVPEGAILFLEDCTERPYRIDRMLTALRVGGHLARAAAIVFGGLTDCPPGPDGVTAEDVVREAARKLGVPCVMGAPFGHDARNDPFVIGGRAAVLTDGDAGRVAFVEE